MDRKPEPELMDLPEEAVAYANADFSAVNEAFVARVLDWMDTTETRKLLDLGTGPGDIPLRMVRARPGWHITAVDGSPAMLALARATIAAAGAGNAVTFVLGDAKALAFAPHSFDGIFSNSLLHHLADPLPFWREVVRVGKPGAKFVVRDLLRPSGPATARAIVEQYAGNESALLQEEFFRSFLAAYTIDEVNEQLQNVGLLDVNVEQVSDRHLEVFGTLPGC